MTSTQSLCVLDDTLDLHDELSSIRRRLHRHPELAYEETGT
ncbi:hypothetical protein C7399_115187, partial [Paraburkholderia tropica]